MKPFDLEKAKAGAPVQTRDGKPARIICFDCKSNRSPVIALVTMADGEETPNSYTNDGRCHPLYEMGDDLFMVSVLHEGWVNLYAGRVFGVTAGLEVFETKEEAFEMRRLSGDYLATVKVTWEE